MYIYHFGREYNRGRFFDYLSVKLKIGYFLVVSSVLIMSLCNVIRGGFSSYTVGCSGKLLRRNLNIKYIPLAFTKSGLRFNHTDTCNSDQLIVYEGPLSKQIRSVKVLTLITSLSGLYAQPVIYERATELGVNTPLLIGICSTVGFFTFVTPFLLHLITKKYVTQVLYDPKNDIYTATVYSLFVRKKEISITPGEPVVPDVLGMFTSMSVRGIPLFVDARHFPDINHYKRIMGYDKPMDFKLGEKTAS